MIGTQILHCRIDRKLGEGGMGAVYLAENTHLHQHVALKFFPPHFSHDPELRTRLQREAVAVGDFEAALDKSEYLLSIPSHLSIADLRIDPRWESLHDHPRFQALLEKGDTVF